MSPEQLVCGMMVLLCMAALVCYGVVTRAVYRKAKRRAPPGNASKPDKPL